MKRIWLKHYPTDIPADISDQAARWTSLAEVFQDACTTYADRYAYQCLGAAITYRELEDDAAALAAWLQSAGVRKGERVALMMPNLIQYPISLYAVLRIGAVVVNINPLYSARELEQQLCDAGVTTLIIAENFAHTLQKIISRTPVTRVIVTGIGDRLGGLKGILTNLAVRYVKRRVPAWSLPGVVHFNHALRIGAGLSLEPVELSQADIACLQYTGGTTGLAKGAILTHGNLIANLYQAHAWIAPLTHAEHPECVITALPLYHIFAFTANCLVFLRLGAKNLLIVDPRDIPSLVRELRTTRFTAITGVNTLFNALINNKDFAQLDFSELHFVLGGGMAVQSAVAQRWQAITGKAIAQAYGLTETSPAVTINPLDITAFSESIGLPVPSTEVAIRDDHGHDLAINESGEICVRGPQVTPGYWNNPEETALVFDSDGFLRTGDIGYMDERGYVWLQDRKKDMILVSGFNVYPNEIEAAAVQHPDIVEAAAIGVPDARSGEAVKLFVVSRNKTLGADDIIAHCRSLLSGYKVPRHVEFRESLPRSNVGKILRRKLKEDCAGQQCQP